MITPKTAKDLFIDLKSKGISLSLREIQRILRKLDEHHEVRKLDKAERWRIDWHPDERAYPRDYWDNHKTDRRIPVYVLKESLEGIRNKVEGLLEKELSDNTCGLLFDVIRGRYRPINPKYSAYEKLEKLSKLFEKCTQFKMAHSIENSILDVCESLRRSSDKLEDAYKIPFQGDDIQSKLLHLYAEEVIIGKADKLMETIQSIKNRNAEEIKNATEVLHSLIVRGGFSELRKHKEDIMDLAFELTERGIDKDIIDGLLDSLNEEDSSSKKRDTGKKNDKELDSLNEEGGL